VADLSPGLLLFPAVLIAIALLVPSLLVAGAARRSDRWLARFSAPAPDWTLEAGRTGLHVERRRRGLGVEVVLRGVLAERLVEARLPERNGSVPAVLRAAGGQGLVLGVEVMDGPLAGTRVLGRTRAGLELELKGAGPLPPGPAEATWAEDGVVWVGMLAGTEVCAALQAWAALIDALEAAQHGAWAQARALGLVVDEVAERAGGQVRGRPVDVAGAEGQVRVRVERGGWPAELEVSRGQSETGNPVLDMALELRGPVGPLVAALEADPDALEHTLACLHGLPGSRVDGQRIELVGPLHRLGELVERGVALAELLEGVAWTR
jgi:hypothetical protein